MVRDLLFWKNNDKKSGVHVKDFTLVQQRHTSAMISTGTRIQHIEDISSPSTNTDALMALGKENPHVAIGCVPPVYANQAGGV